MVLVISPLIPEPCVAFGGAKLGVIEGVEGFRAEVVAVVLPIRSMGDELRVACIAGSPQFEPAGQNRF